MTDPVPVRFPPDVLELDVRSVGVLALPLAVEIDGLLPITELLHVDQSPLRTVIRDEEVDRLASRHRARPPASSRQRSEPTADPTKAPQECSNVSGRGGSAAIRVGLHRDRRRNTKEHKKDKSYKTHKGCKRRDRVSPQARRSTDWADATRSHPASGRRHQCSPTTPPATGYASRPPPKTGSRPASSKRSCKTPNPGFESHRSLPVRRASALLILTTPAPGRHVAAMRDPGWRNGDTPGAGARSTAAQSGRTWPTP